MLFSFDGRIDRLQFWLTMLGITVVYGTVCKAVNVPFDLAVDVITGRISPNRLPNFSLPETFLICGTLTIGSLISLSATVRRYHDRNKSGWWLLTGFVPYIGPIFQLIELGVISGTPGSNFYDLPVKPIRAKRKIRTKKTESKDDLANLIERRLSIRQRKDGAVTQRQASAEGRSNPAADNRPVFGRRV